VLNLGLPDTFIDHATHDQQLASLGLDSAGILTSISKRLELLSSAAGKKSAL